MDNYKNHNETSTFDSQYERENWREMLQRVYNDLNVVWSKELRLIRTEMNEKVTDAKLVMGSFATAGVILFVAVIALVATAIIALNLFFQLWVSAVAVTSVLFIVGGLLLAGAKKKLSSQSFTPERSIDAINDFKTNLQERLHEFKHH